MSAGGGPRARRWRGHVVPPLAAILLGAAGLIPFILGVVYGDEPLPAPGYVSGGAILRIYGLVIFAFMSGALWGFAAASGRSLLWWLALSVAPAIAMFLAFIVVPGDVGVALAIGFPLLLVVDRAFQRARLAPAWWMTLRVPLTAVVTLCLITSLLS